ncbi:hypothetical protein [Bizionia paragorgiae]|uniref:hypothetical protein n=1 Tax=Bizionia paragorgiae TaxID=283786 RepID=UPI003A93D60E
MKTLLKLLAIMFFLGVVACKDTKKEAQETVLAKEDIETIETIEKEMEEISEAIEKNAKELDKALEELEQDIEHSED